MPAVFRKIVFLPLHTLSFSRGIRERGEGQGGAKTDRQTVRDQQTDRQTVRDQQTDRQGGRKRPTDRQTGWQEETNSQTG